MTVRALLISHSGRPFLEHCRQAIAEFLGPARRVDFVTAASLNNEKVFRRGTAPVWHRAGDRISSQAS